MNSADGILEFDDRIAAVDIATRFQQAPQSVMKEVSEATDAVKTQVGSGLRRRHLILDSCLFRPLSGIYVPWLICRSF